EEPDVVAAAQGGVDQVALVDGHAAAALPAVLEIDPVVVEDLDRRHSAPHLTTRPLPGRRLLRPLAWPSRSLERGPRPDPGTRPRSGGRPGRGPPRPPPRPPRPRRPPA